MEVVKTEKNPGITVLLTLLFGPFGIMYADVKRSLWWLLAYLIVAITSCIIPFISIIFLIMAIWVIIDGYKITKKYNENLYK